MRNSSEPISQGDITGLQPSGLHVTLIATSFVHLGLRSIAGYLKANGIQVSCVFMHYPQSDLYDSEVIDQLRSITARSRVIGVSGIHISRHKTNQVIAALKTDANTIVVGGYDPSLGPERYAGADYICRGDGELAMLSLVRAIERNSPPEDRVLPIQPVHDLNQLPFEDYSRDGNFFMTDEGRIAPIDHLLEYKDPRDNTKGALFFMTARGCPYVCSFCEEPLFIKFSGNRKPVRLKKPERVVAEIAKVRSLYPELERLQFLDPEFFSRPLEWIAEFSWLYSKEIALPFWVFGHPSAISEKKVELLAKAGLYHIQVGIQSGSERIRRDVYERYTSDETIQRALGWLHKHGVLVSIDVIFDNPYENASDIRATVDLLRQIPKPYKLGSFQLDYLPGTPLTDRIAADGLIDEQAQSATNGLDRKVRVSTNAYLNSIVRLMAGDCTEEKFGVLPAAVIDRLLDPAVQSFMKDHQEFAVLIDSLIPSQNEISLGQVATALME